MGLSYIDADLGFEDSLWHPSVNFFEPPSKTPNSSLKIAALVGDRLFSGLRYEGYLYLVTPDSWRGIFDFIDPDFLIVESFISSCTGHWQYGQLDGNISSSGLREVIDSAKRKGLPCVYWITHGSEYFSYFSSFASLFDHVFCADPKFAELLSAEGVSASVLLPAAQPRLHNYMLCEGSSGEFEFPLLVDGLAFLKKCNLPPGLIDDIKTHGAKFIDSEKFGSCCLGVGKEEYLGSVTPEALVEVLKRSKVSLTLGQSSESETSLAWRSIQAAACKSLVVHFGELAAGDVRQGVVQLCHTREQLIVMLVSAQLDELYRKRIVQKAWRKVYSEHTFSHRVRDIAAILGVRHDWQEYPLVSVVAPTYREAFQQSLFCNYSKQTYPNKELVLVVNGVVAVSESISREGCVRVFSAPAEVFAASCLNLGVQNSRGDYCIRMDDDDCYGENFLLDMILSLRAVEAAVFGKPPSYLLFEGDGAIYRRCKVKPGLVLGRDSVSNGEKWLAGNSIGGKRDFLISCPYPESRAVSADTGFLRCASKMLDEFYVFDDFNVVAMRRNDVSSHTWGLEEAVLKSKCQRLEGVCAEDILV